MGLMAVLALTSWVCSGTGYLCDLPDTAIIQRAYDQESAAASTFHDRGLRLLKANCAQAKAGDKGSDYLCEVTFSSAGDPDQRLYFDVIRIVRIDGGWQLASGLCKR